MNTQIMYLDELNIEKEKIEAAAKVIKNGGLVAFPTETVYGLGANALNPLAIKKIFEVKGRPQDNPLIIHVASFDIDSYVEEVPQVAKELMTCFWPGPLTLIFKKSGIIPDVTSAGLDTIGLRMPNTKIALELIKHSGVPIAAPSANLSGRPSPTEVTRCIEDLNGKVECIIGGNSSEVGLESTIVDCTVNPPCVLRPGKVSLEELRLIDPLIYIDPHLLHHQTEDFKPKAPGMKYRHYAPIAQMKIIALMPIEKTVDKINELVLKYRNENKKVAIIATDETQSFYGNSIIYSLGSRKDLSQIAKNLFETLRKCDDEEVDIILSEGFLEEGIGLAIMNRLKKAASYDIISN